MTCVFINENVDLLPRFQYSHSLPEKGTCHEFGNAIFPGFQLMILERGTH